MAVFLGWGENNNKEFGATIMTTPRVHQRQPDGTFIARPMEPKTAHYTAPEIERRAEIAGPTTKGFWQSTVDAMPLARAMWENKTDLTADTSPKFAKGPAVELNISAKPAAFTV